MDSVKHEGFSRLQGGAMPGTVSCRKIPEFLPFRARGEEGGRECWGASHMYDRVYTRQSVFSAAMTQRRAWTPGRALGWRTPGEARVRVYTERRVRMCVPFLIQFPFS
ncbi:unnamed protein product, partial [Hapterophycus canaliculatus]